MGEPIREAGEWIYKMAITFVVVIVCIAIVGSTVVNNVNTQPVQKQLMLARILYSPDSVWVTSEEVVYPGIVDLSKFTQDRMNTQFIYPDRYGGAKLSLTYNNQEQVIYIKQQYFDLYRTSFIQGIKNGGYVERHAYPVSVQDGTNTYNGYLVIEVGVPERT